MKLSEKEKRQENILYVIIWTLLFLSTLAGQGLRALSLGGFNFGDLFRSWAYLLPYLILFILHDTLAAPLLVRKNKPGEYAAVVLVLIVAFCVCILLTRHKPQPGPMQEGDRPPMGWIGEAPPPLPPDETDLPQNYKIPGLPEIMRILLGIMMLGANLGVKFYFKASVSERRLQELKTENLDRQIETLRYQINPHFFLNTLNNIHSLVDIDPEKAKECIERFSKLMRHLLYEGGQSVVPLSVSAEYLQQYMQLMQIRYPDSVRITFTYPESSGDAEIPPLILTSFVENAFTHGISYEHPSFVDVSLGVSEGRILFRCVNSRQGEEKARSHGIGIANARERLDLLYGDRYILDIKEDEERFDVDLSLPLTSNPKTTAS